MGERFPTPSREEIALLEPFERIGIDRVSLVSTGSQARRALDALVGAAVLGFDTESKPTFARNELSEGPHIVQLFCSFFLAHKKFFFNPNGASAASKHKAK